jgi:hypothetical protein
MRKIDNINREDKQAVNHTLPVQNFHSYGNIIIANVGQQNVSF